MFWGDDGYDTGPILLQKEIPLEPDETMIGLYKTFCFPEGVNAISESCKMIADGTAPR